MRTIAVVQARLGSTRLPGKALIDIGGKPMLGHVFARLSRAKTLDGSVLATTDLVRDDPLAAWAEANHVPCFRGSEPDVLDRYHRVAVQVEADVIVRITSDCPLIDPGLVDDVVDALRREKADYAANCMPPRTFPRGLDVEAFTRTALDRAWHEDRRPEWREHVTPYLHQNPGIFRLTAVTSPRDHSDQRWTVDTPEDLELVRLIYAQFGHERFSWKDALAVMERHPEWRKINAAVGQKHLPGTRW